MPPTRVRGKRARLVVVLAVVGASLSACAQSVVTEPAPFASAEACALVLQAAPTALGGADRRETTSQASLAWGDPPITLRCGIEPLVPTEDRCITVTGADGTEIDWVVKEMDDVTGTDTDRGRFVFTTYGRIPATQVVVPVEYAGTDATAILVDLGPAISLTERQRMCY